MARLSYADPKLPEVAALSKRIVAERGKVLNLYGMLLNSPPVAEGWLAFLTAIRQKCSLSARVRELVILRVAVLNKADYEFVAHVPFGLDSGMTQLQIDALRDGDDSAFHADDQAILRYTDAMTKDIQVPDAVFAPVKAQFNDREMVELTATIAAYNLVSRFLEAIQVDHDH